MSTIEEIKDNTHEHGYRAAGVLPILIDKNKKGIDRFNILVCVENRRDEGFTVNFLGGKINSGETSKKTAAREFCEETSYLAGEPEDVEKLLGTNEPMKKQFYIPGGKYMLYMFVINDLPNKQQFMDIPKIYNQYTTSSPKNSVKGKKHEAALLVWISLKSFLDGKNITPFKRINGLSQPSDYPLYSFLSDTKILKNPKANILFQWLLNKPDHVSSLSLFLENANLKDFF
jgi:8-oxo-dGTP pyrophosphatase MutT (NUDIX family)